MELAYRWMPSGSPTTPPEIRQLLDSHELTRDAQLREGRPEFVTRLPERGEGRNHDLLVRGTLGYRSITLGFEAKTDEPFDTSVAERLDAAVRRTPSSRVPARAKKLLQYLFARECDPLRQPFAGLRYQLIVAAAATAVQALDDRADLAVFVVHELITWKCDADKIRQNSDDFASFVSLLMGGSAADVHAGRLYGPIRLASDVYARTPMSLLVGKATSHPILPGRS